MAGTILIFVEPVEDGLDETGRGLLSYAARLAATLELPWEVVLPAEPGAEARADLARYGTPAVTVLERGEALLDRPAHLGAVLTQLAARRAARVILLPHNDLGATLAPVAAARIGAALFSELLSVKRTQNGVELSRQLVGLRLSETRSWDGERPLVVTVPPRSLSQVLLPSVRPSQPVFQSFTPEPVLGQSATVTGRIPPDPQTVDLVDAEVIFSAGKGCDRESFDQLQELCRLLQVSCGVTRPVYDLGYTGFERMVGQTGRTVTPRLYLALGISGSMHHVGGIKDARRIVSVNLDAKAPIFPNSDEGYVADVKELLPLLLERARASLEGAGSGAAAPCRVGGAA